MKISIDNASKFRNQFVAYNRDNFTHEAYELLFDHFEDIDPDMVLDVICVCCDYSEDTLLDIIDNYSIDVEGMDEDEKINAVRKYLEANTIVVGETASGFVYAVF
jgi:hypothetical protein